ncbi:flagellar basal body L-ring protein FlgH [bacterium]|nr:flagellar basal body L-ring protein FlgH [bacterium]MBU1615258.1 flagellar basal body L-ring protein FlgH [bacterium]
MKKFLILAVVLGLTESNILAESLWRENANLFTNQKACQVGDVVTIVISESSQATHSAVTSRKKDVGISGGPETGKGATNVLDFLPFLSASGNSKFKGSGQTARSGQLLATVTAQVMRVYPNGNLGIEGKKVIRVNTEEEEIVISGIVRPSDIEANNTVLSASIADADIKYRGKLTFSDEEKPGFIAKLVGGIVNIFF